MNGKWSIPSYLLHKCPALKYEIQQITIPFQSCDDYLIWTKTDSDDLCFKDAYTYQNLIGNNTPWAKIIWSKSIPPSKSFLLRKIIHDRIPTNEKLWARGRIVVSVCSHCGQAAEIAPHLFLVCIFARQIWSWLGCIINLNVVCSNIFSFLSLCSRGWCCCCKCLLLYLVL